MTKSDEKKINEVLERATVETKRAIHAFDIQMRKLQTYGIKAAEAGKNLKDTLDTFAEEMKKESKFEE